MSLHFDEHNEGKSFDIGFGLLDGHGRSAGVTVSYEHNPRNGSNDRDAAIAFAKTICDRFNGYQQVVFERDQLLLACKARVADWDSVTQPGAAAEGCPDPIDVAMARAAIAKATGKDVQVMSTFRMESQVARLTGEAQEALARLFIGQAVEVFEKTGKTPKQIADERGELAKEIERLQALLSDATELIETTNDAQTVGSDTYVFLKVARELTRNNQQGNNQ